MDQPQGELKFDRLETQQGAAQASCAACRRTIADVYFEAGGKVFCEPCKQGAEAESSDGSGLGRFLSALALGTAAAMASAAVWYGVVRLTGYELGIVAVVVGLAVGIAVRTGSRGRGGWPYQALAIGLTYLAVVTAYVPQVLEGMREEARAEAAGETGEADAPAAADPNQVPPLLSAIVISVMLPVLQIQDGSGVIGALIVGFALYEAWKINRRTSFSFAGPFRVGAAT